MDRTLILESTIVEIVNNDLIALKDSLYGCDLFIWTKIPEKFLESYYQNEQKINPAKKTFEAWKNNISKSQNIIYSVAIMENKIISSIMSNMANLGRMINLWQTSEDYQNKGYGKAVLLNCLSYLLNNQCDIIYAWDVTSSEVDTFLTKYGFK